MSVVDAFNDYFEMIPASSNELKQEVYKLRYQIYCLEKGFLSPSIEGMEYDEYDAHSSHYLIRHRESGSYMATTRLILPDTKYPEKLLPLETYSQIDNTELLKTIPRSNLAELSRFCVSKQFRRRANEKNLLVTNDVDESYLARREKGSSAHLTLALFACAIKMSSEHNIHYWCAIIEPALKRVFSTLGIYFVEVGPLMTSTHYYGMRTPCIIKVDDLLRDVAEKNLDYWSMLNQHKK